MPQGGPRTKRRHTAGTGQAQRRRRGLLIAFGLLAALVAATLGRPAAAVIPKPKADLQVTKASSPLEATPGGSVTYTVVIANDGPSGALEVAVEDALPPAVSAQSAAITRGSCDTSPGLVSCAIGPMLAGDAVTLTVTASVAPDAPAGLTNCATVRNDEDPEFAPVDEHPDNDTSCVTTRVLPVVGKLIDRGAGSPFEYVLQTANTAGEPVLLDVAFTLPAGRAAADGSRLQVPRLPAGGSTIAAPAVGARVVTRQPTTVVATARAVTAAGGVLRDNEPTPLNGGPLPPGTSVLRLRATSPSVQLVAAGGQATLALQLENVSGAASSPVQVAVTVPSGLVVVAGPATWNVPSLPPLGAAATELTIRADRAGRYEVAARGPGTNRIVAAIAVADVFVVDREGATGRVFRDDDADGIADPGEAGIQGIIVQLLDPAGTSVAAAFTDGAGRYSLPAAAPGHRVEVLSAGFVTTTPKIRLARAGDVDFGLRRGTP